MFNTCHRNFYVIYVCKTSGAEIVCVLEITLRNRNCCNVMYSSVTEPSLSVGTSAFTCTFRTFVTCALARHVNSIALQLSIGDVTRRVLHLTVTPLGPLIKSSGLNVRRRADRKWNVLTWASRLRSRLTMWVHAKSTKNMKCLYIIAKHKQKE